MLLLWNDLVRAAVVAQVCGVALEWAAGAGANIPCGDVPWHAHLHHTSAASNDRRPHFWTAVVLRAVCRELQRTQFPHRQVSVCVHKGRQPIIYVPQCMMGMYHAMHDWCALAHEVACIL